MRCRPDTAVTKFQTLRFPPVRLADGRIAQWEWSIGPSTREAQPVRQTQPAVAETLISSERDQEKRRT